MFAKIIESYRNYASFVVPGSALLIRGAQSAISKDQILSLSEGRHLQELLWNLFETTIVLKRRQRPTQKWPTKNEDKGKLILLY